MEHPRVAGPDLAQSAVQEAPAAGRALLHQQQVLRGENHRADLAHQGGACLLLHPIDDGAAVLKLEQSLLLPALAEKVQGQGGGGGVLAGGGIQPGQLHILGSPEGVPAGEQPQPLQQICLSLGVIPIENVGAFIKIDI